MAISSTPAQDALKNLAEALLVDKPTPLERDGIVQRFEIAFEQTWKYARRILKENGVSAETPKEVFMQLGSVNWIDNVEDWLSFQRSRNETSHEYGEKFAQKSHELAKTFLPLAQKLHDVLIEKSKV